MSMVVFVKPLTLISNSKITNLISTNLVSAYPHIPIKGYRGLLYSFVYRRIPRISHTETHDCPHTETAVWAGINNKPYISNPYMQDSPDMRFGIGGLGGPQKAPKKGGIFLLYFLSTLHSLIKPKTNINSKRRKI